MKNVKVLGGGCTNCKVLAEEVKKAAEALGVQIELEKVEDFTQIAAFGVMSTPALVVDGEVVFQGQVKKAEELKEYLV